MSESQRVSEIVSDGQTDIDRETYRETERDQQADDNALFRSILGAVSAVVTWRSLTWTPTLKVVIGDINDFLVSYLFFYLSKC